ncbi:MAG: phosphotransferase [Bacteroides sp.]|nr:phosphotransferase [Bacteroides sp.]
MIERIISAGTILFYRFANADGKMWLMPARNMRVGMNLYQPSGIKGKALKLFFPCLHRIGWVRRIVKAERMHCQLDNELQALVGNVLGREDVEFAIFGGTPCVHQKMTVQLSRGESIEGYCKVTDNDEVFRLFDTEAHTLQWLNGKGIKGIPQCLYCGKMEDGTGVFMQSTDKTLTSTVVHEWERRHEDFLSKLYIYTRQSIRFEDSEYYGRLTDLQQHRDWLPDEHARSVVSDALERTVRRYGNQQVEYSAYHADFTPWNMFVEKGKLFVFDWEYAGRTYPPMMDRYHFFTQTARFEKHWDAERTIAYVNSPEGEWIDRELYRLYLLEIISRFCIREKGKMEGDVAASFDIWIKLLEYLGK